MLESKGFLAFPSVNRFCTAPSNRTGFLCDDRVTCIPSSWVCDRVSNCRNGEDEQEKLCGDLPHSLPGYLVFLCSNPRSWIYADQRCNGMNDCGDCSDESGSCKSLFLGNRSSQCHTPWLSPTSSTKLVSSLVGSQSQGHHQCLFCWGVKGFYLCKKGGKGSVQQKQFSISFACFPSFPVASCPPCGWEWWSCIPVRYEYCSCIPRRLCRDGVQDCLGWSDEYVCRP
ncbi:low-density lipoprotein receptor class A domain-containing protein 1 [Manacus candei]|uniref:low-density lipoprotein receptor class A domain-containing protein 1 n=1 Tax=Manacus candei TaxID=415023 RepID=UPI0022267E6F|nr:low-density lipoprotein receptor class A domain-containing protein 1 [Manacus candei]